MIPDHRAIAAAVDLLRAGRLVAFPTETVYGLGASATSRDAVRRVFALKGRPSNNPLIVHVADITMARAVVREWPKEADQLARAFWPGPLTLILPRAAIIPDEVTAGSDNVAVRCPDHPLTLTLLCALGGPLVGPSANPSGEVSPTTAQHVRDAFPDSDLYILDGGPCKGGIESTVLSLTQHPPMILRPGLISAEAIAQVIKTPVAELSSRAAHAPTAALPSPGMLEKHYAPRTPASLVAPSDLAPALARVRKAVVLAHQPVEVPAPHTLEALPADARGYAAALYAALRHADTLDASDILIVNPAPSQESPRDGALWLAILDRLHRACARA